MLIAVGSGAQDLRVNNHFLINPYVYNPAFAGIDYRWALYANFRQHWFGIEEAPQTITLSTHIPFNEKLIGGLYLENDQVSFLNNIRGYLSFGYILTVRREHKLRFAMSAGISQNQLDYDFFSPQTLDQLAQVEDFINLAENNLSLVGNFGFVYQYKSLDLGLSLPRLIDTNPVSDQDFNATGFDPLREILFTGRYAFELKRRKYYLDPVILYRHNLYAENVVEGYGVFRFQGIGYAGAGYRLNYGLIGTIGLTMKNFNVSFAFDYPLAEYASVMGESYEVNLGFLIGKERGRKKKKVSIIARRRQYLQEQSQESKNEGSGTGLMPGADKPTTPTEKTPTTTPANNNQAENTETEEKFEEEDYTLRPSRLKRGSNDQELAKGSYVMVESFYQEDEATQLVDKLFQNGYYTEYGYNSQVNKYFVYIYYSRDILEAREERDRLRQNPLFKNSWVLFIY